MKKDYLTKSVFGVLATLLVACGAQAAQFLDTDLTNGVIFGDGNANGDFTVDRTGNFEVGLRAKIPFSGAINPNAGTNTYSVYTNTVWNFDWGVNTDYLGADNGSNLSDYTYLLELDQDTGVGTNFFAFDPITPSVFVPYFDHALGDNNTTQNATTYNVATDAADYALSLGEDNVAQNSWSYSYNAFTLAGLVYDISAAGTYDIRLSVRQGTTTLSSSTIQVIVSEAPVVPLPGAAGLGLLGMGLVAVRRRFRKTA